MKVKTKWMWAIGVLSVVMIPLSYVIADTTDEYSPQKLEKLRAQGPEGLQQLIEAHRDELDRNTANPPRDDTQWNQLCAALDKVGGQKDNYAARLYWYTDLEAAKTAAAAQNKPILSLRLLGKLTDELSCANSRFFRTALYPNEKIGALLREDYILHWSSERPVPIVTIDMGDGRQIKRTLTGNSAHYLLDEKGAPLDVMPGLNAPGAFARWLESGKQMFDGYEAKPQTERAEFLADYHQKAMEAALLKANPNANGQLWTYVQSVQRDNPLVKTPAPAWRIPAVVAAPMFATKVAVESSVLNSTRLMRDTALDANLQEYEIRLAAPYLEDAKLDANSLAVLRAKNPPLEKPSDIPRTDSSAARLQPAFGWRINVDAQTLSFLRNGADAKTPPFERLVQNFERAIAYDTARNQTMHNSIHALFAEGKQGTFEELNRKIYDRLFLTPRGDEWLGLDTPGIYTAIDNGGILTEKSGGE